MKTHDALLLALILAPIALIACDDSQASQKLPAATGESAAPLPEMPQLKPAVASQSADEDTPLRATGSTRPIAKAELGPKSSGVLSAVLVDEGDRVTKNQVLFRLDSTTASLGVRQAEAGLAQARVGLAQAQLEYDRTKPLSDKGAVSPAAFDRVRIGLDQAKVGVQQAEIAVASAKRLAADTVVVSPLDGVVTEKRSSTGESVTSTPPTIVLVVQDLTQVELRVKLPERALNRVAVGDPIEANFRALGEKRELAISRINPSIDSRSRTVEVVALLDNPEGRFKSGMLVECTFPRSVPASATAGALSAGSADAVASDSATPQATGVTTAQQQGQASP